VCPEGGICEGGSSIPYARPGYWTEVGQAKFYRCQPSAVCLGGKEEVCLPGHTGIICASCMEGYSKNGAACVACGRMKDKSVVGVIILSLVLLALLMTFAGRLKLPKFLIPLTPMRQLIIQGKLILTYFQLVMLLPFIGIVKYPPQFRALMDFLTILNLDIFSTLQLDCIGLNYFRKMCMVVAAPFMIAFFFVLLYLIRKFLGIGNDLVKPKGEKLAMEALKSAPSTQGFRRRISLTVAFEDGYSRNFQKCFGLLLLALYCIHLFCSFFVLSSFSCRKFDLNTGPRYFMRTDLSIECNKGEHHRAFNIALFGCIFPVGLPLFYFSLLWYVRDRINNVAARSSNDELLRHLRFIYFDYKPEYYWWETVEGLRKVLCAGFMMFVVPGTILQLCAFLVITLGHVLLLDRMRPYQEDVNNSAAVNMQVFFFHHTPGYNFPEDTNSCTRNYGCWRRVFS